MRQLFTSESVTEGHPDKVADQISDAILDAYLAQDRSAHVAVETLITGRCVHIAGEVKTAACVDLTAVARQVIRGIGYSAASGFDPDTCDVITSVHRQASQINDAVFVGAGDQGIMFGYACRETPEFMPLPIMLANRLARNLDDARHTGIIPYLYPDGKTQVTIEYDGNKPVRLDTVSISSHHDRNIPVNPDDISELVVKPVLDCWNIDTSNYKLLVNPGGPFNDGGPGVDTGLTGRKIIADTYGGKAHHGGGAFSGKDPTKVDRSAAYLLRWIAKNVVSMGMADECELQLSYVFGNPEPVSFNVRSVGDVGYTKGWIMANFDLSVSGIFRHLYLQQPIYRNTATYGHFGRTDIDVPWESPFDRCWQGLKQ